jgi:hypothetical protein
MNRRHALLTALATTFAVTAGLSGCSDYQLRGTEHSEVWVLDPSTQVDILFVVDDSPSMVHEHLKVKDAFADFIFEVNESEADWHIGVTTTDMESDDGGVLLGPEPLFITPETPQYPGHFMAKIDSVGTDGSGWEKGLMAAERALLDGPDGFADSANVGFLRPEADLAIVVISDENDCSDDGTLPYEDQLECYQLNDQLVETTHYIDAFEGLKGDEQAVTFSAIVGPPAAEACEDATPGHRYLSVVPEFDGLQADICEMDYSSVMAELGLVATGVQSFYALQGTPDLDTVEVRVDGEDVPQDPEEYDGWSYHEETNSIYLWGAYLPDRGATVEIYYWTH